MVDCALTISIIRIPSRAINSRGVPFVPKGRTLGANTAAPKRKPTNATFPTNKGVFFWFGFGNEMKYMMDGLALRWKCDGSRHIGKVECQKQQACVCVCVDSGLVVLVKQQVRSGAGSSMEFRLGRPLRCIGGTCIRWKGLVFF